MYEGVYAPSKREGMCPSKGGYAQVLPPISGETMMSETALTSSPESGEGNGGRNARTHRGVKRKSSHTRLCTRDEERQQRAKGAAANNTTSAREHTNTHAHTRSLSRSLFHSIPRSLAKTHSLS